MALLSFNVCRKLAALSQRSSEIGSIPSSKSSKPRLKSFLRRDQWCFLLQPHLRWNLSVAAAIGNKKLQRWLALFTSRALTATTPTICLSLFEAASQTLLMISATLIKASRRLNLEHLVRKVKHLHPMSIQESKAASKVSLNGFKSLKHLAKDRLQEGSHWHRQCLSIATQISSSEEARSANQTVNLKCLLLNPSSRETTVTICLSALRTPRKKDSHLMKSRRLSTKMKIVKRALWRIANSLHRSKSQSKGQSMTVNGTTSASSTTQDRLKAAVSLGCH